VNNEWPSSSREDDVDAARSSRDYQTTRAVVFSPDGNRRIASGEVLKIWDATPGK
jgi:hypothetical protein